MKVLQYTRNERNIFFKPDRPDCFYRDSLFSVVVALFRRFVNCFIDPEKPLRGAATKYVCTDDENFSKRIMN